LFDQTDFLAPGFGKGVGWRHFLKRSLTDCLNNSENSLPGIHLYLLPAAVHDDLQGVA
jgi:hypothetical protein